MPTHLDLSSLLSLQLHGFGNMQAQGATGGEGAMRGSGGGGGGGAQEVRGP